MGKTLDALKKRTFEARQLGTAEQETAGQQAKAVNDEPTEEEISFVEVGGPNHAFEASPSVWAAAKRAKSPAEIKAPKTLVPRTIPLPASKLPAGVEPRGVLFQAVPELTLPAHPCRARWGRELVAYHEPDHPVCAQYRGLFSAMNEQVRLGSGKVILLAGVCPGAGTTTVVLNLAAICARQCAGSVVVVDANLQRPAVSHRVGLPVGPGLRDVLSGRFSVARALQNTGHANLLAITAGEAHHHSGPLPRATSLRSMIAQVRRQCHWMFLDGPAWEGGPELAALVACADMVYLVLRPAEVGTASVLSLMQLIPHLGGELGGYIVVTGQATSDTIVR
jgi:tyrosine-protein kinase Etk/Wzc